ncbi:GNAT family N-acetyltransferase [Halalkalibacterium halodurans]|uniref:GNAT family acetyltransferase n=1 Tax=Halalkalibacterium halodurans TaxID=86665 RepID=A0A0M0KHF9_ALKHA|nr:GNAT family N-acetyltransferase [Halalkalibacterium halodurans]MED3646548.1 GNAT family N-acetyltransferase [Halalkalibacterium halodurans]TES53802.1 GNAT family N-acetyltransferase [Halalkalibacterium halodurans]TPE68104.1 GNAT family N-acetyltransferase [Halalkalibacterium halodurans]
MKWHCKTFQELTKDELYELLRLRVDVFVVEQACPYSELDGYDQQASHLFGIDHGTILAYARLFQTGVKYDEHASIGRVIIAPSGRGKGLGHTLMEQAIGFLHTFERAPSIQIQAQAHLQAFYQVHGFHACSEEYVEDGIPHVEMIRPSRKEDDGG